MRTSDEKALPQGVFWTLFANFAAALNELAFVRVLGIVGCVRCFPEENLLSSSHFNESCGCRCGESFEGKEGVLSEESLVCVSRIRSDFVVP